MIATGDVQIAINWREAEAESIACRPRQTQNAVDDEERLTASGALFICAQSVIQLVVLFDETTAATTARPMDRWTRQWPNPRKEAAADFCRREIRLRCQRTTAAAARSFSSIIGVCNLVSVRARTASRTHVPALIVRSSLRRRRPADWPPSRTVCLPHMMHRAAGHARRRPRCRPREIGLHGSRPVGGRRTDKFTRKCCG